MILWWCNAGMVGFLTNGVGVFQFLLFTSCIYFSDSQILRLCADKNDGDPCLLSCQTSDVNQVISISKSPTYAAAGSCLSDGTCFSADNLLYNISQSAPYTNLEIFSFNKSDNATWRCEYTGNPPYDIFLSWSKLPTSIMELSGLTSNVTITNDLTISVEVGCLYSLNDPITNLQLMCAGTLVTTHAMSCIPSTTVCSDSDLSAYICNYTITSNPPSQTCNSGNTGYSLKAVVSFDDTTQSYDKNIFVLYTVSFESPTNQTSAVFMTERMTTTVNYINEYNNTTLPTTLKILIPTNSISENLTPSSFISHINTPKKSTSFFDSEILNSTFIAMSSENSLKYINSSDMIDIPISHVSSKLFTSPDFRTETTLSFVDSTTGMLMPNLILSSFDSLSYIYTFSSQTDSVYSQIFIETSFPWISDIKSNTIKSIPDVSSETSLTFIKLPTIILTDISTSSNKFYSTVAFKNSTNESIGSTFGVTSLTEERASVPIFHTRTTQLFTLNSSNGGIILETESTNDQHGMSDTVRNATLSNTSSEFSTQALKTTQTILSTDTVMPTVDGVDEESSMKIYSSALQTHSPDSIGVVSSMQTFPSETSKYLSTTSLSDLTLKTSYFKSSIYTFGIGNDIITTIRDNSLMPTSIDESISRTTESRMFVSGYLLFSFYPTAKDFSSRATEYFVSTTQTTNSYLESSTEKNPSSVNSNLRTTDIMAFATQSSMYTVQNNEIHTITNYPLIKTTVQLSDLGSAKVTSEPEWDSLTSYHSFSRTTAVSSLITAQFILQSSNISVIDYSDSPKVLVSASVRDSSSVAFIPKTVYSTSNTKAGLGETTKNVIFITTVSVVAVFIFTVSSIMLLRWVVWKRKTLKRKTDNAILSNDTQSVRKIFPEFPYMKGSIYPRFCSTVSSTYMTSPYEQNWNKV